MDDLLGNWLEIMLNKALNIFHCSNYQISIDSIIQEQNNFNQKWRPGSGDRENTVDCK